MKFLCIIVVIFLSGCGNSAMEYNVLKAENLLLKERLDSLSKQIDDLKFGSVNLFEQAKTANDDKDFITSKSLLSDLITKYPSSKEVNSAKNLLKLVAPKAEYQSFQTAVKSGKIESLRNYVFQYPRGKYFSKVNGLIKKHELSQSQKIVAENHFAKGKTTSAKKTHVTKTNYKESGERVGALCCDGTRSYATGRGACSHHGGVCEWLYQ